MAEIKPRLVEIDWDTDGVDPESLGIPTTVEIPSCIDKDDVVEWLSDEYGYCINSLKYIDNE